MTTSYSPELSPHTGTQQAPGATAFYNNTLYYIGNGHNADIWVLSRTLGTDSLDPNEDPDSEKKYWSQKVLQDEPNFKNPTEYKAETFVPPACAIAADYLYFIWIQAEKNSNQAASSVWATRLTPGQGGKTMDWSAPVCLCGTDGSPLIMPAVNVVSFSLPITNFSVTGWGDYLVGCYNGKDGTHLLVYDTGDWPSPNASSQWKARSQWSQNLTSWPNFPAQLGGWITMDWFTPGGAKKGTSSASPALYLIISFFSLPGFSGAKNEAYVWHVMDLTSFDQWTGAQPFANWQVEHWTGVKKGVNVIRDPAGRVRAYHADQNNDIVLRTLATNQVSSDGYSWSQFGQPEYLYGQKQGVDQAPVPAFVMGPGTTENGQTVSQVYEFVMFKDDGINLRFSHFGKAVRVPDAYTLDFNEKCVKPGQKPKLVVTGLVDSPLPMPKANFSGQSVTGTVGSVDYGTTQSKGHTRSTSWSWSAGFMSEGYATAGAGPAWQISFNAGMAGGTGRSETTQIGTELVSNTDAALPSQGNYFHAGVVFHRDEYTFYDLSLDGQTYTKASNAPTITSIWITYTSIANNSLQTYANTAGNLWSYTKAGWNARMKELGYKGDNYFDEVITAQDKDGNYTNAVVFGHSGSANPFLNFSWSTTGSVIQQYHDVSSTYEESGWHMDASVYAGYSFDVGAEVFGVGEEQFGELLFGGSYSRTTQEKTTDGTSWGITVDYDLPSPSGIFYPGDITALHWKLYLLKANKQWTEELIQYGDPTFKDQVDPNSAPWRIVFEVDEQSVVFQGDNRNLVYRDGDDQIIEAWYYPGTPYSYGSTPQGQEAYWSWTNLTQEAVASGGSAGALPKAAGEPYWFAWGMDQPGCMPYTQAVVFRAASGDVYFLWSDGYDGTVETASGQKRPKIAWSWRNLGQIDGFVKAAGDPVGFHWEKNPWGPSLSVIYRGVDGDMHELWADPPDGEWKAGSRTASLPAQQKPASDPCALVWNEDPGGPSEHFFYRGKDSKIYGMYYDRQTKVWTQTAVSAVTNDGATPTGKPCAFVWNGDSSPSLHVGYRGSTGEIHDLFRQSNKWQPATDPSFAAHATATDQRVAEGPICGFAWERRTAKQTIHWFYLNSQGNVCGLSRGIGKPSHWGWTWTNLSQAAKGTRSSGSLPAVAEIMQGYTWYFDPAAGSSMNLYLGGKDGSIYELRYEPTSGPNSGTGAWQWTELTGWVTDANGDPLPNAATASG